MLEARRVPTYTRLGFSGLCSRRGREHSVGVGLQVAAIRKQPEPSELVTQPGEVERRIETIVELYTGLESEIIDEIYASFDVEDRIFERRIDIEVGNTSIEFGDSSYRHTQPRAEG